MDIVKALAECLENMRRGADLEACLKRYPECRAELQPLLETAALIRPLPEHVVPSPAFRESTRSRILGGEGGSYQRRTAGGPPGAW